MAVAKIAITLDKRTLVGSEQAGMRPVMVLSKNVFNDKSGTVSKC